MDNIIVKLLQEKCPKCYREFQPQEEVVMVKNSSMLHKKCFDEIKQELEAKNVQLP